MEPQLEDTTKGNNMENDETKNKNSITTTYNNQASDKDYEKSGYDRGHLLPCSYANDPDDKASTFTLTNVVPQVPSFNQGSWNKMENNVKCIMEEFCVNNNDVTEAYVMVGAKPSVGDNMKTMNNRVNVPSLLWSAFCCHSKNLNQWIAGAHWGDNVEYEKGQTLPMKTLKELYDELKDGTEPFEAFPNLCPLDKVVVENPSLLDRILGIFAVPYSYIRERFGTQSDNKA